MLSRGYMAEPQLYPRPCGGHLCEGGYGRTSIVGYPRPCGGVEVTAEPAIHGTAVDLLLAQLSLPLPRHCSGLLRSSTALQWRHY